MSIDLESPEFTSSEYVDRIKAVQDNPGKFPNLKVTKGKILIHIPSFASEQATDISEWKLWIPSSLAAALTEQAHNTATAAHMGIYKTINKLKRQYYWPQLAQDVSKYIRECSMCKQTKAVNSTTQPVMGKYKEFYRPWQKIYIDFLGPYPRSKKGNTYIFIVLDHYSRFPLLIPIREATASKVVEYLETNVFSLFSVPEVIMSDNGPQFKSKLFDALLQKYGIKHMFTPVYSPQANASERVNRSILAAIRAYLKEDHQAWDTNLPHISSALRNTVHTSTSFSPAYLVYGQHMIQHGSEYELLKLITPSGDSEIQTTHKPKRLSIAQEKVLYHLRRAYEQSTHNYNLRSQAREFSVGQQVLVRNFTQSNAAQKYSAKLTKKFIPATVKQRVGTVAYELLDQTGKCLGMFHAKDIRSLS